LLPAAIIAKKRDREALSEEEIRFMISGLVNGSIPDYQISAWAMAVLCRGMSESEIAYLTDAMLDSGSRLQRVSQRPRVDKHSTGGLGDKVSLILAPLLACHDVDVPMLSGRGLGITGGTLDKLESYAGFDCHLTRAKIDQQLQSIGCVITGTTPDIAPADRKLYGLRDVTGTVPSIALITSSIMSKKLAASLDALVLDVKCGSGAFMRELHEARALASSLGATGQRLGVPTRAIITDMNQPLGQMVGNACEVNESVDVLRGGGPADVRTLTLRLAAELLVAVGRSDKVAEAEQMLGDTLDGGSALRKYQQMIEFQGGRFADRLPTAAPFDVESPTSGWVERIDGQQLGHAIIQLGGGRAQVTDLVDHAVGLEMLARVGDRIDAQQPIVRLFARSSSAAETVRRLVASAIRISSHPTPPLPLIYEA
jgi:pyrimidine-nucleoside phosphorylase